VSALPLVTLLRHAWARHRVPLITIAAAVGLFEFILTRIAPASNQVNWIATVITTLPPEIRSLLGSDIALSSGGFLALGYGHPFFIALQVVWVVRTSSAAVADEVGRGTMDLLATRPVARWHFVAAGMTALGLGLGVILAAAWAGTAVGLLLRPLDVHASAFVPVAGGAWLLFAAWGAVGLAIGASRRTGGQAISWTTTIVAAAFVLDYITRLWATVARLRPLSPFRYYEPQAILASGLSGAALLTLGGMILAGILAGLVVLYRRDL